MKKQISLFLIFLLCLCSTGGSSPQQKTITYQSTTLDYAVQNLNNCVVEFEPLTTIDLTNQLNKPSAQGWFQGACADSQGKYIYIAVLGYSTKTSAPTEYTKILKIDASSGKIVKRSQNLKIEHANCLTYNNTSSPVGNQYPIIVSGHSLSNGKPSTNLFFLNENLEKSTTVKKFLTVPYFLCYDKVNNRYAAGVSGSNTMLVLDKNLKQKNKIVNVWDKTKINGSGECNNKYVFITRTVVHDKTYYNCTNYIDVYDWNGKRQCQIKLPIPPGANKSPEIEDIFLINNQLYATFSNWETGYIYKINFKKEVKEQSIEMGTMITAGSTVYTLSDLTALEDASNNIMISCTEVFKGPLTSIIIPQGCTYGWTQGATYANGYVYLIIEGYNSKNGTGQNCSIWKIPASNASNDWAIPTVALNQDIDLGHGNGATYVNNLSAPIIVCNNRSPYVIHKLTTAGVQSSQQNIPVPIHSLSYCPEKQQYIAGTSGGTGFFVLNSNFSVIGAQKPGYETGYINQGGDCTQNLVLFPRMKALDNSGLKVTENIIHVQDWNGNNLHKLAIPFVGDNSFTLEIEDLFHIGNQLYATFADWDNVYIYRINIFKES